MVAIVRLLQGIASDGGGSNDSIMHYNNGRVNSDDYVSNAGVVVMLMMLVMLVMVLMLIMN